MLTAMEEKLRKYRKKRDFSKTNEPAGRLTASHGPLRFCVQWHDARSRHFDFRLEWEGVAVSWAIPKGPSYDPKDKRLAVRVEDHPVEYMSFEGVIPKGEYGGGTVMLWDEGTWTPKGDPKAGLEAGSLKMTLAGQRLKGDWALVRMKAEEEAWLLLKERDGLEKRTAGVSRFSRSVRTDRTMAEIARAAKRNPFSEANVMLAELSEGLPSDMGWLFEVKYDGHRTLAFCEGGVCALKTRSGLDCTAKFSVAAKGVEEMLKGRAAVLDGEMIVAGKDGVSDFGALQAYAAGRRGDGLAYVLFDLLALDGEDLRARPCIERKERLEALVKGAPPVLAYSRHAESMTAREAERLRARGLEGIVMKRADSPYTAGRTGDWRKWKFRRAEEFVIGGYLPDEAGAVRSLLVGLWEGEALAYAGCVGTGFSEATRRQLAAELKRQERSPFASLPAAYARRAVFVVPAAVAQVAYAELTRAGRLRQASFQGLREDKAPGEVRREQVSRAKSAKRETSTVKSAKRETSGMKETEREKGTFSVMGIRITHPDKTMFEAPMYTKGALAEYYAAVAPVMFPYAKDRPLSLVCCPAGIGGERFFRRHLEGALAGVKVPDGADGDFFLTGHPRAGPEERRRVPHPRAHTARGRPLGL